MRPAGRAWFTLFAGVITYDVLANDGETLTECARRHPILTSVFVELVGEHLRDRLPIDPISIAFDAIKRVRNRP